MDFNIKFSKKYRKDTLDTLSAQVFSLIIVMCVLGKHVAKNSIDTMFKFELAFLCLLIIGIINTIITLLKIKSQNFITVNNEFIEINRTLIKNKKIYLKDIEKISLKNENVVIYYKDGFEYLIQGDKLSKEDKISILNIKAEALHS